MKVNYINNYCFDCAFIKFFPVNYSQSESKILGLDTEIFNQLNAEIKLYLNLESSKTTCKFCDGGFNCCDFNNKFNNINISSNFDVTVNFDFQSEDFNNFRKSLTYTENPLYIQYKNGYDNKNQFEYTFEDNLEEYFSKEETFDFENATAKHKENFDLNVEVDTNEEILKFFKLDTLNDLFTCNSKIHLNETFENEFMESPDLKKNVNLNENIEKEENTLSEELSDFVDGSLLNFISTWRNKTANDSSKVKETESPPREVLDNSFSISKDVFDCKEIKLNNFVEVENKIKSNESKSSIVKSSSKSKGNQSSTAQVSKAIETNEIQNRSLEILNKSEVLDKLFNISFNVSLSEDEFEEISKKPSKCFKKTNEIKKKSNTKRKVVINFVFFFNRNKIILFQISKKSSFIVSQAELSNDAIVLSEDEEDLTDELDESFVDDEDVGVNTTNLHAFYLQTTRYVR